jgi:hypothetical protein
MGDVSRRGGDAGRRADRQRPSLADRLALRPAEVAEALGLSERTIRQILPELPHIRAGRAVLLPPSGTFRRVPRLLIPKSDT